MPQQICRKTTAILLCWVMTLVWCQGMVYSVKGELGMDVFEIVDLQVVDDAGEDYLTDDSEENNKEVQVEIRDQVEPKSPKVQNTVIQEMGFHVVQSGDTLSGVAQRYQTTLGELMQQNYIHDPDSIFIGQKIRIPAKENDSTTIASELSRGRVLVSQEELELLARVIHDEARGENFVGQIAVGAVVLNRVEDHRFPSTIHDVVYQAGAFAAVDDKQIHLTPNDSAYRAAEAALMGEDPTDGAIYYYNPRTATDRWIKTRPVVKTIGNHTFSI